MMDSNQIKQVFTNLFTNAIEAMPEGGILGIRAETATGEKGQPHLRVVVSDTGEGIPEDKLRKIFDPFFYDEGGAEKHRAGFIHYQRNHRQPSRNN